MTYEISNMDLHNIFRNRPCRSPRRRDSAIVWPHGSGAVPDIPFKPYAGIVCDTFRDADAANKRVEDYLKSKTYHIVRGPFRGWSCDWDGILVQPPVMPPRRDGGQAGTDGKRQAPGRSGDDVRSMDYKQIWQTAFSRWKACKNTECREWKTVTVAWTDNGPGRVPRSRGVIVDLSKAAMMALAGPAGIKAGRVAVRLEAL